MKKGILILVVWILGTIFGLAQTELPFFEQIAFDFYGQEILKNHPVKKRISVYRFYSDFQKGGTYIPNGKCFEKPIFENQTIEVDKTTYEQDNIDSGKFELDFSQLDKKQFKIRRNGRGSYPKLFMSYPLASKKEPNRFFVNVSESYDRLVIIYHLEINKTGKVVDWCKSQHETIVVY
ncbi:hypothetical protein ABV409_11110 [Flagellimonas sp. DF-77]|uniref:hypothetical protein n=1 Tax=Flagellimonas algarum TaxID=3230298 RepID=UPI003391FB1E